VARVSTYLDFPGTTEKAFEFYRSVFGTDFDGPIARMGEAPPTPRRPPSSERDRNLVMQMLNCTSKS